MAGFLNVTNYMKYLCLFIGLWLVNSPISAQFDDDYVETYADHTQVSIAFRNATDKTEIASLTSSLKYTNQYSALFMRVQFDRVGLGFKVPNPLWWVNENRIKTFGASVQAFPGKLMINAGVSRQKNLEKNWDIDNELIGDYNNVKLWHAYINPLYVLNGKRFSPRAIYQLTHHHFRSGGSPLVGLRWERFAMVSDEVEGNATLEKSLIDRYRLSKIGVEGGYAHILLVTEHFYIGGVYKGELAMSRFYYRDEDNDDRLNKLQLIPISELFASMGFQGERYFTALQCGFSQPKIASKEISIDTNTFMVQLMLGVRLYQPSIYDEVKDLLRKIL